MENVPQFNVWCIPGEMLGMLQTLAQSPAALFAGACAAVAIAIMILYKLTDYGG